jgi:hypothetical protein
VEYVPELAIANDIERHTQMAMYAWRATPIPAWSGSRPKDSTSSTT